MNRFARRPTSSVRQHSSLIIPDAGGDSSSAYTLGKVNDLFSDTAKYTAIARDDT